MSSILNSPDILAAIQQRKKATGQKLKASRTQMLVNANMFWSSPAKATTRAEHISRLVSNGVFIYNGLRICTNVLSAVRSLFGRRKRRR